MTTYYLAQASRYNPGNTSADTLHRNLKAATTECDVERMMAVACTFKMPQLVREADAPYPYEAMAALDAKRGDIIAGLQGVFVVVRDMEARTLVLKPLSAKRASAVKRMLATPK